MIIFWLVVVGTLFMFGFVVLFGAPYVPTLKRQQKKALDMLDLQPGQVFYDLGCGDGRILLAAARSGAKAIGYEINPLMALVSWLRTRRCPQPIKIVWGNFWKADIEDADGVFVFLIEHHMDKLDKYLSRQLQGKQTKVVSYGFKIPGKKPLEESGAVFLYKY